MPDIMTLGKGIGGGVPLAALLATEEASCFEHGDQGGTFNGNPLMARSGSPSSTGRRTRISAIVVDTGRFWKASCSGFRRGMASAKSAAAGCCCARPQQPIGASIARRRLANGVLLNSPQPDALRFMPALNVAFEEIDCMAAQLDVLLAQLR